MRRRRKWLRRLGRAAGTLAIGMLIGFIVPTVAADMAPKPQIQASVKESPLARQFINAFVTDDATTLDALGISIDMKQRASRFLADYARVDAPVHLGSYVGGGYTVSAYAIHVVRPDGTEDTLSWRVYTAAGQVGVLLPPTTIESE
jgi:hypothetical protein